MRTVFKLFIQYSVLNEFSVESRPKLFKLELGSGGGGGGGGCYTCTIYIFCVNVRNVCFAGSLF